MIWYLLLFSAAMLLSACVDSKAVIGTEDVSPEVVLKLNAGPNNPRNSEGDFIKLSDGRILFIYTHYYGHSTSDHATAYLASRLSSDGGSTWSQEDQIVVENEGQQNVMSVSLLRLQSGDIALFYMRKNSLDDCITMMRVSRDEALTWSEPISCIMDQGGYYVLNNDRVIQTKSGRILVPVSRHSTTGGEWSRGGILSCYFSDDNGKTWLHSDEVPNHTDYMFQEPGLIEQEDQSILMFFRSDAGTQCFTTSKDGGKTWSIPSRSQLVSPRSPATIERIPHSNDLLAVWNNNLTLNPEEASLRTPLSIAISDDKGISWKKIKSLENDPDRRYCYTAMHFIEDAVLLAYADGSYLAETHWGPIKMIKVPLSWINQLY
ncbi:MAG: exo-alpha-sialidase [Saprospiraceae bacterium]|nr:exo-alpha-sialidase [Saprospiraceae bacterium]